MPLSNTFQDSVITVVGKNHFVSAAGVTLKFSKFKLAEVAGTIDSGRTTQTGVKYTAVITSASEFVDGTTIGYMITCRIPRGAVATAFNIAELGLYDTDGLGNDILCWVGKPDVVIPYTSLTDVTIQVIIPIEDKDILIDVQTNPQALSDHNNDINAHTFILNKLNELSTGLGDSIFGWDLRNPLSTGDLTFTDGTLTFSIAPKVNQADFQYYHAGSILKSTTAKTAIISNTQGLHVVYFSANGAMNVLLNPSDSSFKDIFLNETIVAAVYWDVTLAKALWFADLRYSKSIVTDSRLVTFETIGTRILSGLSLSGIVSDGDGSSNTHMAITVDSGETTLVDLNTTNSAVSTFEPLYYSELTGMWKAKASIAYPLSFGTNRIQYNKTSDGTLVDVQEGYYVFAHVIATNDKNSPIKVMLGQAEYSFKGLAESSLISELLNISQNQNIFKVRPKFIASVLLRASTLYTNLYKCAIQKTLSGKDYYDLRDTVISGSIGGSSGGGATGGGADEVFYENDDVITTSYTVKKNAVTVGPITISDGAVLTIEKRLVIL